MIAERLKPQAAGDWRAPHALVVVDVQAGFDDPRWGRRDNPACEANIAALLPAWRRRRWPVVLVRHDSRLADSPLAPGRPGNAFKPVVEGPADLLVVKHTNSAFYGRPDLHAWLAQQGVGAVAICGMTTNHCCETTARMAGNLGYDTKFIIDATCTFDRVDTTGEWISADVIARVTAANLNEEFATVVETEQVLTAISPR